MKFYFLLIIILITTTIYSQTNCEKFKTGKFENKVNGIVKSIIERNDSIQREFYGNKEIKLKITWFDDCTYRLKLIWGNDAFWDGRPKKMLCPDLIVRIIKIDENECSQEAKSDGEEFTYKSILTKIH